MEIGDGETRAGLEHDRAVLLSQRRLQKQLAVLAGQCAALPLRPQSH